jgi:hypothetical protein
MSVAEIKSELAKLSAAQLAEIDATVQALKGAVTEVSRPLSESFGCARGTITFLPGWDEPEPPETWNAMRDDLSL